MDVAITAMSVQEGSKVIIASENGELFEIDLLHSTQDEILEVSCCFNGGFHYGPITAVSVSDHSLLLSCSVDWSVKLWSLKVKNGPVLTFDYIQDYIYDAVWYV